MVYDNEYLKLKETVNAGLQNASTPSTSRSIELPEQSHIQEQSPLLQKEEHQPSDSLNIVPDADLGPKSPESEWVIGIEEKLEQAQKENDAGAWAKLSIYRVPLSVRKDDDKSYIPQIVSLGPYHHGRRRFRNMDRHKWRAVYHILKRTNQKIKMYIDAVRELEEKARACYEGTIRMSSNEFVEMMVLDSCFILELFRGVADGFEKLGYDGNDPVFAMRQSMHSIQRDMIMIENQVPLLILDKLYGIQSADEPSMPTDDEAHADKKGIVEMIVKFFEPLMPTDEEAHADKKGIVEMIVKFLVKCFEPLMPTDDEAHTAASFNPSGDLGGLHCLDVFRRSLLQPTNKMLTKPRSPSSRVADKRRQQLIHSVSELKEAGIKFEKGKTNKFWDVKFENGILKIPRLLIHYGTKSLFLNLITFEQCHLQCTSDITSYVIFLDNLIDSPEDVSYLHYCGIIEHWLGSDAEVADLFNRLCQEVIFDRKGSYLSQLSEQINSYSKHRWNVWRAALMHKCFKNPWAIISFAAAVILLLLTMAQTFYEVYGYYRPAQ